MTVADPVCGKEVDTLRARAVAIVDGVTYFFCSAAHKEEFLRDRESARPAGTPAGRPAPPKVEAPPVAAPPKVAAPVAASAPAPDDEEPYEVRIVPRRSRGPMRFVVAVLLAAAIAVVIAFLSHKV